MTAPHSAALALFALASVAGCTPERAPPVHPGILWVRNAAEFEALALQVYRNATDFLPGAIANPAWSALPQQADAAALPPAIILDVDETVLSNVEFQATFKPPFSNSKLHNWSAANRARPVPGAVEFAQTARAAGVEMFFVTNRPCASKRRADDPCPQETVTVADLNEAGFATDAAHVMLAKERPGWNREKLSRRMFIAASYRVLMLVGDDLSDFIPCTRKKPYSPCTENATAGERRALTREHKAYWGAGWFVLPNPMHGSWTKFE